MVFPTCVGNGIISVREGECRGYREVYTWLNEEHIGMVSSVPDAGRTGCRSMVGQGASRHTGVGNACITSYLGRNTPINLSG